MSSIYCYSTFKNVHSLLMFSCSNIQMKMKTKLTWSIFLPVKKLLYDNLITELWRFRLSVITQKCRKSLFKWLLQWLSMKTRIENKDKKYDIKLISQCFTYFQNDVSKRWNVSFTINILCVFYHLLHYQQKGFLAVLLYSSYILLLEDVRCLCVVE